MYMHILLPLPFLWPLLNTDSYLFLQKHPLGLCPGEELGAGSSVPTPSSSCLSLVASSPAPCSSSLCVLCAQLVSDEILGFLSDNSQVYCIYCYLFISVDTIGFKKAEKDKWNGETDGYLCIQMVTLLSVKQWKLNVCCIYKRILVDAGICGCYQ